MKAEEFDQYVRSQFRGETAMPSAGVEEAVFAAVDAESKGRRRVRPAAALLIAAATGTALWLNAPESVPAETPQPVQAVPVQEAPVQAAPVSAAPAEAAAVAREAVQLPLEQNHDPGTATVPEQTALPSGASSSVAIGNSVQPQPLEPIGSRVAGGLDPAGEGNAAELQRKGEETWVLPAVVKVND